MLQQGFLPQQILDYQVHLALKKDHSLGDTTDIELKHI